jgi:hypothetical protein
MNTDTPRTDEAAVDVWRKSNGERMATSSDKVDADFSRKLERELNEARFDLDFSRRLAAWQSKTIDDLTAQRDEARDQRDKLAVALETAEPFMRHDLNCYARIGNAAYKCHCGLDETQFLAKHALQSLTQKP